MVFFLACRIWAIIGPNCFGYLVLLEFKQKKHGFANSDQYTKNKKYGYYTYTTKNMVNIRKGWKVAIMTHVYITFTILTLQIV